MTALAESLALVSSTPPPHPPRPQQSVTRVLVSWALLTLSIVAAWLVVFAAFLSGAQEAHDQRNLYNEFREQLAKQTAPLGGSTVPDKPVALLNAPALGLRDLVVVEGTASGDLRMGPGHRRDTVLPGQAGAAVLYGRASLFGGPFGQLDRARMGDKIDVVTGQGRFTYTVSGRRRPGDPLPPALASGGGRLTLVTSSDAGAARLWSGGQPLFVDATLSGHGAASPGVGTAVVPRAEQAMRGDESSLSLLVLWLPLLIGVAVAIVWAALRWGFVQAWLVGVPVLLFALWGSSEAAAQLLPNLV